jgi:hypothetical protein
VLRRLGVRRVEVERGASRVGKRGVRVRRELLELVWKRRSALLLLLRRRLVRAWVGEGLIERESARCSSWASERRLWLSGWLQLLLQVGWGVRRRSGASSV